MLAAGAQPPTTKAVKNPRNIGSATGRSAYERELLARLQEVVGLRSFRSVSDASGVHCETVRRYLRHGRPSIFFVASLCRAMNISPEWMFLGTGPKHIEHDPPPESLEFKPGRGVLQAASPADRWRKVKDG